MKVAICFSGQIREMEKGFSYWEDIIQKYKADVYGSFWNKSTEHHSSKEFDIENQKDIFIKELSPKRVEFEDYKLFESTFKILSEEINVPIAPEINWGVNKEMAEHIKSGFMFSMWYKVWKANLMSKFQKYDVVVRTRTDIYLDEEFDIQINDNLNIPWGCIFMPHWKNSGGPIDVIAYGKPELMDYYSSIYLYLTRYLKEGHYFYPPENMLGVHLSQRDINIRYFPSKVFLDRNNVCYNNSYGITKEEFQDSKLALNKSEIDPTYNFYKPIL